MGPALLRRLTSNPDCTVRPEPDDTVASVREPLGGGELTKEPSPQSRVADGDWRHRANELSEATSLWQRLKVTRAVDNAPAEAVPFVNVPSVVRGLENMARS